MKLLLPCFLALTLAAGAQPSPYRVLQPIMKNPNQRNAPSSVTPQDLEDPGSQQSNPQVVVVAARKPAVIVAKIDPGLAVSKVTVMARITGIKGTIYVTNLTSAAVEPHTEFAICDRNGFQIGTASKVGPALDASAEERIDVVATNVGSVDLKLMKLSAK